MMKCTLGLSFLIACGSASGQTEITYFDVVEGPLGNTFATGGSKGDTSWLNPDAAATADEDQWRKRTFGNGGSIFQAFHNGNTIPELTTEVTGLADGSYDVWVFFWDGPNSNQWTISAGLNPGNLTTYSFDGPGNTAAPVSTDTLTFTSSSQPLTTEDPRILYGVLLGQTTVSGGSAIQVFIDNNAGGGSDNRTWFDGVGIAPALDLSVDLDNDQLPDVFEQMIIDADPGDDVDGLDDVMGTGAAPAITDFDNDGSNDLEEFTRGTNPLLSDTDNDGLDDGVENLSGDFIDENRTGTDPLNPDTDGDGTPDGAEVAAGSDPTDSASNPSNPFLSIEFNRNDAFAAPSQSHFRIIGGSATQNENSSSYTKTVGSRQVTISRPDDLPFEFRGGNGDSSRAIPGGDTSLSFLVSDFVATRRGEIQIEITNLPAGNYFFRSYHLDTFTGGAHGFAQGTSPTTQNSIEALFGGTVQAAIQPNSLGTVGLNTTFIEDGQIPVIAFTFSHDGLAPAQITLQSTLASSAGDGTERFLLLNGFQLFQVSP